MRAPREHQDVLAVDSVSDLGPGPPWTAERLGGPADAFQGLVPNDPLSEAGAGDIRIPPLARR